MSQFRRAIAALDRAVRAARNPDAPPATIAEERRVHKFERAGLGHAPFYYLGTETKTFQAAPGEPHRPGSSCDYCSTAIAIVHRIRGSGPGDQPFKVGSDCVLKMGDAGLRVAVESAERTMNRKKRAARQRAVVDEVRALLDRAEVCATLAAQPHPRGFRDRDTGALTLLDWAEWMMANAGTRGRAAVRAEIRRVAP